MATIIEEDTEVFHEEDMEEWGADEEDLEDTLAWAREVWGVAWAHSREWEVEVWDQL